MTQYGQWVSYGGTARLVLPIILLAAAGGVAYIGIRFRRPVRIPRPGRAVTIFMLVAWVFALGALLAGLAAYVLQERHDGIAKAQPADPVQVLTLTAAVVMFIAVFAATDRGIWARTLSGVLAAMAAPWIFEVPFDLIIMTRTDPPVPPDPALYRAFVFAPLVLVGLTTLSLLALAPLVKLSRPTFFCLALMLLVFAVWALAGFGYPSAPFLLAMNDVSKVLAFITALSLFVPEWFTLRRRYQPDGATQQATGTRQPQPHGV